MISTELASRILLTVIIVGAFSINYCLAAKDEESHSLKPKDGTDTQGEQPSSSLDSPIGSAYTESRETIKGKSFSNEDQEDSGTRLMPDSEEAGILLPYDEDFPQPGGARGFLAHGDEVPASLSFPTKPLSLRISNGKSFNYDRKIPTKSSRDDDKSTYYLRNNCFGPRCIRTARDEPSSTISSSAYENWKTLYYNNKDIKANKYDDNGPGRRLDLDDNAMESLSSNFHAQLAVPFMVVDNGENALRGSFSKRNGISDRFSSMTTTTSTSPPGWVKLKPISADAYDPFHFPRNVSSRDTVRAQNTFTKRDSSKAAVASFSKRVGVELNPDSFADRWGWSSNNDHDDKRGGSRLPAWLEEQLKFGNRNTDNKNWVKLEPIPVAGVSISKWVPKGTHVTDLPTTSWQNNRDRPNGGSPWWDRIDEHRILNGNRHTFLRPGSDDSYNPPQSSHNPSHSHMNGGWGGSTVSSHNPTHSHSNSGWGGSTGSSLSSLDRYPTNSWNDIVYPEGPVSATVSWQQSKGGISGGGNSGGWPSQSDNRKPIVATGSWSAPQNSRFPSFINRFGDNRPSSSYPAKQVSEDDPRWVLISNSRRVTSAKGHENNRHDKILNYINRLHPDIDRNDFPFYESIKSPHRHGKDLWPYQHGSVPVSPEKEEAFHRVNATLSTLTPVLVHRGGTTIRPPVVNTIRPANPSEGGSIYSAFTSGTTLPPFLSPYIGDGRATSNAALQSSTTTPLRNNLPGRIRQGLKNINPVYAAVGAGMIPATLAAVMPMVLGRRRRSTFSQIRHNNHFTNNNLMHLFLD